MNTPCRDCKNRTESCHITCEKYREYAERRELIRKARNLSLKVMTEDPYKHNTSGHAWRRYKGRK